MNVWVDFHVGLLLNIKRQCFINGIVNCAFGSRVFIKLFIKSKEHSVTKSKVSH